MNQNTNLGTKALWQTLLATGTKAVDVLGYLLGWVPLTLLGALLVPLLTWLLVTYGIDHQDKIILAVSLGGLVLVGLMLAATLLTVIGMVLFRAPLVEKPLCLEAGVPEETGYRLPFLGWLPLVQVDWGWTEPAGVDVRVFSRGASLREEVTATERATQSEIVRLFVVRDLFGLTRFTFRKKQVRQVSVYPRAATSMNCS